MTDCFRTKLFRPHVHRSVFIYFHVRRSTPKACQSVLKTPRTYYKLMYPATRKLFVDKKTTRRGKS